MCYVEGRIQVDEQRGPERKTYWNVLVEKLVVLDDAKSARTGLEEPGIDSEEYVAPADEGEPVSDEETPF